MRFVKRQIAAGRRLDREAAKTLKIGDSVVFQARTKRGCFKGRITEITTRGEATLAVFSEEFGSFYERRVPADAQKCDE